ncbi:MAG: SMP-30/gluconolactonase/LRE family protein [Proteobacteria bacterium]|nr:SMP-30/gluconolactonase/LRE family protein [Pseudomonadota bacterium]
MGIFYQILDSVKSIVAERSKWDPTKNLTSCCFGGHDLKTLFVTSANFDLLDINDVGEHAGAVFASKNF